MMRNKAGFILFVLAFVLLGTDTGCVSPSPPQLPDKDIVFQRYPLVDYDESTVIGFINADGTGFEEREIVEESGGMPTWSADGKLIFYRWWPPAMMDHSVGAGSVSTAGMHICSRNGILYGTGRPRTAPGRGNAVVTTLQGEDGVDEVGVADPAKCEVLEVIYRPALSKYTLNDPALSVDGLLVLQLYNPRDDTEARSMVMTINLETGEEREIGYGVGPSWSPNGQWIAYTARDGIYVVRSDGSESRRVVDYNFYGRSVPFPPHGTVWRDWPPYPEWSPDGQWLVYHLWENRQYNIHKLNLETGDDEVIFEGGLYPHWRWVSIGVSVRRLG